MKKRALSLVIVGHVDHGKSTLIGRLLFDTDSVPEELIAEVKAISDELGKDMEFAYFLDALEEEREQNITIDTTQTFFSTPEREYIIIDAPGHKEFLKNMITGVSQAEAAVLMVDAEQGMEEQTSRHAYILSMLGVEQVLVAMNKMDAVGFEEARYLKVKGEVEEFLGKINVQAMHVIPLSAKDGDNIVKRSEKMGWHEGPTLLEALNAFETHEVLLDQPLRMPVQDIYSFDGEEIIAGRVESGRLQVGDTVTVQPGGVPATISAIKVWNADDKSEIGAGESTGLLLACDATLKRGDVICPEADPPVPASAVNATIFWMSDSGYKAGEQLAFQCATQSAPCHLASIESRIDSSTLEVLEEGGETIGEAEAGKVTVALDSPVVIEDFLDIEELGRFVLVRGDQIVAGGIIHI